MKLLGTFEPRPSALPGGANAFCHREPGWGRCPGFRGLGSGVSAASRNMAQNRPNSPEQPHGRAARLVVFLRSNFADMELVLQGWSVKERCLRVWVCKFKAPRAEGDYVPQESGAEGARSPINPMIKPKRGPKTCIVHTRAPT